MGKHSRRRRRVVLGSVALVSSAVGVVVATASHHNNIASLQNNDPAAAPTLHITHHSSTSNNNDGDGEQHCRQDYDNKDSLIVSSSSQQSLTTVFSCGTNWRSAQTCGNTICPSGLDADCPNGQYCYGGIIPSCTTTTNDNDSGERKMDEMLKEQSRLEQQLLNDIQARNENENMNKFVCGTSYDHASSTCNTDSSTTLIPSSATQEAIYCPYGSEEEESCPSDMECYIVSCTNDQKEETHSSIISLIDEISSWLVQLFHDKQLLLFSTGSYNNDEQKEDKEIDSNNSTFEGNFRREGGIFSERVGTLFTSSSSEGYVLN